MITSSSPGWELSSLYSHTVHLGSSPLKAVELNQFVCSTGFPLKWKGCYLLVIIVKWLKLVLR